mmetsp:Transcript_17692/g.62300  ORF Transcript_17692/g.62300 Transcript_17692/m.62300 type:complete len:314 (-) Transcript_17692:162-1103(-)
MGDLFRLEVVERARRHRPHRRQVVRRRGRHGHPDGRGRALLRPLGRDGGGVRQRRQGPGHPVLRQARAGHRLRRCLHQAAPARLRADQVRRRHRLRHHVRPGHLRLRQAQDARDLQLQGQEPGDEEGGALRDGQAVAPVHARRPPRQHVRGADRRQEGRGRQPVRRLGVPEAEEDQGPEQEQAGRLGGRGQDPGPRGRQARGLRRHPRADPRPGRREAGRLGRRGRRRVGAADGGQPRVQGRVEAAHDRQPGLQGPVGAPRDRQPGVRGGRHGVQRVPRVLARGLRAVAGEGRHGVRRHHRDGLARGGQGVRR